MRMRLRHHKALAMFVCAMLLTIRPAFAQFAQQTKLVGTGAVGAAQQGIAVAVSADGDIALVGGWSDNANVGAAWIWTRSAGVWTQQGKLLASDSVGAARQGISVSLSADGNTAAVGGSMDNGGVGALWIYARTGGGWIQQGTKLVGSGAVGNAQQGISVSLSADGNTAIVGGAADNGSAGAAWVWTRTAGVWTEQGAKLVGTGAAGSAQQGTSVSLAADGNTAVIGGPADNSGLGAAWVWIRTEGVWTQQGRLVGSDAAGSAAQGTSVSLSANGNTALIGGPADNANVGAAWAWIRSGTVWTQQGAKLVGSGAVGTAGQGISVSLSSDGNTALVGGNTDNGNAGAAWAWRRSGSAWTQQGSKLVGTGATATAQQGRSVALSGNAGTALVGGPNDDANAGAAWVFVVTGPTITIHPANQTVAAGATATFTAASNDSSATVQWQVSSDGGSSFTNITGATSTTYAFTASAADNGKQFRAVFTNSAGSTTTTAAILTVIFAPVITTQPVNQTVSPGGTATFTATASGNPAPDVQWQVSTNGGASFTNISGATSTTYSFTAAQADNGKQFRAVFSNTAGSTTSNAAVLTVSSAPIIVTQPANQTVPAGSTATFTAAATGDPAPTVQWQVSTDGGATFTNISGATSTTLSFVTAASDHGRRYRAVFTNAGGTTISNAAVLSVTTSTVSVDRTSLRFAAITTGSAFTSTTPPQTVRLRAGSSAVTWTATSTVPWLVVSPTSGSGPATLTISVQFVSGLSASQSGAVNLAFTGAANTAGPINVTLTTVSSTAPASLPFGNFDTPTGDATVLEGSVAVTGWTLDNIAVQRVELWRDLQPGETTTPFSSTAGDPRNGKVFIANATFVDGARPDVEALNSSTPLAYRAGWGYLMLTWGLWNQGNGTYRLHAFAFDQESNLATIGAKTIVVNNAAATRPFGSIDAPAIGGEASGPNFGWALTPKVNGAATCKIQPSGVQVSIDSGPLQPVLYGDPRPDIAAAFPGYSNSAAAGGHYIFDWTTLSNGVHTIQWLVTDDCNRADGIGSRFFTVSTGQNLLAESTPAAALAAAQSESPDAITVARGHGELPEILTAGDGRGRTIEVKQGERVEIRFPRGFESAAQLVNGGQSRDLPAGSTWDAASGTFSWEPAPGFLGRYRFVFSNGSERISVRVVVRP